MRGVSLFHCFCAARAPNSIPLLPAAACRRRLQSSVFSLPGEGPALPPDHVVLGVPVLAWCRRNQPARHVNATQHERHAAADDWRGDPQGAGAAPVPLHPHPRGPGVCGAPVAVGVWAARQQLAAAGLPLPPVPLLPVDPVASPSSLPLPPPACSPPHPAAATPRAWRSCWRGAGRYRRGTTPGPSPTSCRRRGTFGRATGAWRRCPPTCRTGVWRSRAPPTARWSSTRSTGGGAGCSGGSGRCSRQPASLKCWWRSCGTCASCPSRGQHALPPFYNAPNRLCCCPSLPPSIIPSPPQRRQRLHARL
jgi:hypothetical protein